MYLHVKLNRDADSFQPRAKTLWIPLRLSKEICRLGEGYNLFPNYAADYLLEIPSPEDHKNVDYKL